MTDVITFTRPKTEGHLIAHEYDQLFTRATRAKKAATAVAQFAVLGAIAGVHQPIDFAGEDGEENAIGIAVRGASAADTTLEVLENGPAVVRTEELVWPVGASAPQKAGAIAQLRALNIKVVD